MDNPPEEDSPLKMTFSKLQFYEDVETSEPEDDHHWVAPPVTPELLSTLLKQVKIMEGAATVID